MSASVQFFFDYSSPYSYLASTQIESVVADAGGTLVWKPFLLGAVFKAIGTPMVPMNVLSPQKRAYNLIDMKRWADFHGADFSWPSNFPMNSVKALRITLALDDPKPWIHRVYRAFWVEDRDISSPEVLGELLEELSIPKTTLEKTADPQIKARLFAATEEAIKAGVFGAPTMVVTHETGGRHLFWGQDRLDFVQRAIGGWSPPT